MKNRKPIFSFFFFLFFSTKHSYIHNLKLNISPIAETISQVSKVPVSPFIPPSKGLSNSIIITHRHSFQFCSLVHPPHCSCDDAVPKLRSVVLFPPSSNKVFHFLCTDDLPKWRYGYFVSKRNHHDPDSSHRFLPKPFQYRTHPQTSRLAFLDQTHHGFRSHEMGGIQSDPFPNWSSLDKLHQPIFFFKIYWWFF